MVSSLLFPDSKIELKLEKREPLKGRAKTPVTLKQRRIEHNQVFLQFYGHINRCEPSDQYSSVLHF